MYILSDIIEVAIEFSILVLIIKFHSEECMRVTNTPIHLLSKYIICHKSKHLSYPFVIIITTHAV